MPKFVALGTLVASSESLKLPVLFECDRLKMPAASLGLSLDDFMADGVTNEIAGAGES
jgi:hypothetical protein